MSRSLARCSRSRLYGVTTRVIAPRPLRAFAAFVAAQSALLYGYSQWGGVKEIASAALLVLLAVLTPPALQKDVRARNLLPLATATAASARRVELRRRCLGRADPRPGAHRRDPPSSPSVHLARRGIRDPHCSISRYRQCFSRRRFQGATGGLTTRRSREPDRPPEQASGLRDLAGGRLPLPPAQHPPHVRADRVGRGRGCRAVWCGPGDAANGVCSCTWPGRRSAARSRSRSARRGSTARRWRSPLPPR